jgi:hypothetical protein
MKLLKTKRERFSEVVEQCGRPQVYTLWIKPKTDRHFQSLLRKTRVMTILQTESGTDLGLVGFREGQAARYLTFPKSLKRHIDKRIVGIRWELVRA